MKLAVARGLLEPHFSPQEIEQLTNPPVDDSLLVVEALATLEDSGVSTSALAELAAELGIVDD